MLKKLFFTAAAATALSVPLAGAAWAVPDDNTPPGQREDTASPGIPGVVGKAADAIGANPNPGQALPPGQAFKQLKDGSVDTVIGPVTITGGNAPERYGDLLRQFGYPVDEGSKVPGGLGVKAGTPACKSGTTAAGVGQCS
jgi:hypothetical protein